MRKKKVVNDSSLNDMNPNNITKITKTKRILKKFLGGNEPNDVISSATCGVHENYLPTTSISNFFHLPLVNKQANYELLPEFRAKFRLDKTALPQEEQILDFKNLKNYDSGCASIIIDKIKFHACLYSSSVKKLYVSLTSGNRKKESGALFTRWKWRNYFDGYFLALDDPMFEFNKSFPRNLMGWFYGTQKVNFMDKAAKIIQEIAKLKGIKYEDITLIGSSSGGTVSLYVSNKLPGCSVIAFNPQCSLSDWPYAKQFENAAQVDLSKDDERNVIKINPNMKSKCFIYYNLISDSDVVQMNSLIKSLGCNNYKVSYGINKLTENIYLLTSVVNYHKLHTSSPNEYESLIISKFLELCNSDQEFVCNSGFFTYMSENISSRYELMNNVYRIKTSSTKQSSNFYDYAVKNFNDHCEENNYLALLRDYKLLFSIKTFSLPNLYIKNTVKALASLNYSKKEVTDYFNSCTSETIEVVKSIIKEISIKDFIVNNVYTKFMNLMDDLFSDDEVKSIYKEAFLNICNAFKGCFSEINQSDKLTYVILSDTISSKVLPKITDYSKEIFLVDTKCNLIGYKTGFASFVTYKNSKEKLSACALNFFFKNLIGCSYFKSVAQYKQVSTAFRYAHQAGMQKKYAEQVRYISVILANIIGNKSNNNMNELISLLGNELIRLIAIALDLPTNKILIFKSLTHTGMNGCEDYLYFSSSFYENAFIGRKVI